MSIVSLSTAIVDFNSVEEDGTILCATRRLSGLLPASGESLTLVDREGHTCQGLVTRVEADRIAVAPVWETWRSPAEEVFQLALTRSRTDAVTTLSSTALRQGETDPTWTLLPPLRAFKTVA